MPYKAFSLLGRNGLGKIFTHGSAQPIVSFAQSSSQFNPNLLHANSRSGDVGKFHNSFQGTNSTKSSDGGLLGYFTALQNNGDEWKQYNFQRRIGFEDVRKPVIARSHSENYALDPKVRAQEDRLSSLNRVEELPDDFEEPVIASSDIDVIAESYLSQLQQLRKDGRLEEVAAVFETMIQAGVAPTTAAYEILLEAALSKDVEASSLLAIYTDMLRRRITVSATIYDRILNFLSSRLISVQTQHTELEQKRTRYGGMTEVGTFLLPSNQLDFEMLAEEDSLSFIQNLLTQVNVRLEDSTYSNLIVAFAHGGHVTELARLLTHLETVSAAPPAHTFGRMISAFAKAGDLPRSEAVYRQYIGLVTNTKIAAADRRDPEVHAALVKAFMDCNKHEQAERFYERVLASLASPELQTAHRDAMIVDGMIPHITAAQDFPLALKWAAETERQGDALAAVARDAADADSPFAEEAYNRLHEPSVDVKLAMLAFYIRRQNVAASELLWNHLRATQLPPQAFDAIVMATLARIHTAPLEEVLNSARQMWVAMRQNASNVEEMKERIDEAVEFYGNHMFSVYPVPSSTASMELMWTMIENGGLVPNLAEMLLSRFGPEAISQLNWQEMILVLQIQAGIINRGSPDLASVARFSQLFEMALSSGMPLDERTCDLIEQSIEHINRPDLVAQWRNYLYPQTIPLSPVSTFTKEPFSPQPSSRTTVPTALNLNYPRTVASVDEVDPHAAGMDFRGSAQIAEALERGRRDSLNDALTKMKHIRQGGRHLRYITYAKLIAAAAKDGKMYMVNDVFALAQQDVPLLYEHAAVRYGWIVIFDAMVAACLNLGDRSAAVQYHQQLSNIGAAPSANTFGLYITTMKESTKTNDEASEAVSIFRQAKQEGVEPTSFLYNALIGKLGKARRIDDCLFYFNEMRALGIKPTSVTYGTMVNALCRVSDENFAESVFEEMEAQANYKPRAAPYNSMIQFFLTTKRDRVKALGYYERMKATGIAPTSHTYKLLIDVHATLQPINMEAAEEVVQQMKRNGCQPEAVHFASLIHAKGCISRDVDGARKIFERAIATVRPQACLYQALLEGMVAAHQVPETEAVVSDMRRRNVEMTPYIANTLVRGWAQEKNIEKATSVYNIISPARREPSLYDSMTRAYLAIDDRQSAMQVVQEMLSRGYPAAVSGKLVDLVNGN